MLHEKLEWGGPRAPRLLALSVGGDRSFVLPSLGKYVSISSQYIEPNKMISTKKTRCGIKNIKKLHVYKKNVDCFFYLPLKCHWFCNFKAAVLGFRPFTRPARRAPARWKLLAARHRQRQRKSLHGTPPKQSGADYSPWLGRRKRSPEPRSVLRYWQRWAGLPVLTDLIKPEIPRNAEVDDDDSIADPQWAKRYGQWMVRKNG